MDNKINLTYSTVSGQGLLGSSFISFVDNIEWEKLSYAESQMIFYHLSSVLKLISGVEDGSKATFLQLLLKSKQDKLFNLE